MIEGGRTEQSAERKLRGQCDLRFSMRPSTGEKGSVKDKVYKLKCKRTGKAKMSKDKRRALEPSRVELGALRLQATQPAELLSQFKVLPP